MSLRISHHHDAISSYRSLSVTPGAISHALEHLADTTPAAAHKAAEVTLSDGLRAQVGGLQAAARKAQEGVTAAQTTHGALSEAHVMLQRMRHLLVQAATHTPSDDEDRRTIAAIQHEIATLTSSIHAIAERTELNGTRLLDGSTPTLAIPVGDGRESLSIGLADLTVEGLGITGLDTAALAAAHGDTTGLARVDRAITEVEGIRDLVSATGSAFEKLEAGLAVAMENLWASASTIRDSEVAQETMTFTRSRILAEAGTSVQAQVRAQQQTGTTAAGALLD